MSAPSTPYAGPAAHDKAFKKRERPPALDIYDELSASEPEHRYEHRDDHNTHQQPQLHVQQASESTLELETGVSRSTSATSTLDPYYFGLRSPSDSPVPPLPDHNHLSTTPETRPLNEPVTPVKDPANIDRRGLVGVGELTTPRWTRAERDAREHPRDQEREKDNSDLPPVPDVDEDDPPDSPWTIEAIDGESDEREEEPAEVPSFPRTIRPRPSLGEESGGEEILYPRKADALESVRSRPSGNVADLPHPVPASPVPTTSPPTSFATPLRKAKKRTSEEFELDNTGALVTKRHASSSTPKDKAKEEKASARKHRSLGVGMPSTSREKGKERRRDSVGLGTSVKISTTKPEKHTRQTSTSSSSGMSDAHHSRRVHTTDFSHLPPSPSTSSIKQFLRHAGSANSSTNPPLRPASQEHHSSPNVAHSLLRGTQEGWSGMDDDATAEALRKLDGLGGKTARSRASVGSLVGRRSSSSRPGTPSSKSGTQWEGVGGEHAKVSRRTSVRDSVISHKDSDSDPAHRQVVGLGLTHVESILDTKDPGGSAIGSSDDQGFSSTQDRTPKKSATSGVRTSFSAKRGSASSTTYTSTSTPTTSSRDSASLSAATSATSVSGRHSIGKAGRNSAGSDVSSIMSGEPTSKDRNSLLAAAANDTHDDGLVPPVPPLPKDLTGYKSPPTSATNLTFPSMGAGDDTDNLDHEESDMDRTISLEVPPFVSPSFNSTSPQAHEVGYAQSQYQAASYGSAPESIPVVVKTPSKKWSFSNALNIKLSSSPSSGSSKESPGSKSSNFALSPRSSTFSHHLRKIDSKEKVTSPASAKSVWSPQSEAMTSAASLASLSSAGSTRVPKSPGVQSPRTPDRGVPSRPSSHSSASTTHTSGLTAHNAPLSPSSSSRRDQSSKRLTPSSIPFFRRSSSQSMQVPPLPSSSPPPSSGYTTSQSQSRSRASPNDYSMSTLSTPSTPGTAHKKSSVLSLGLPSLLKGSSSRRSLHGDRSDSKEAKETQRAVRDAEKEKEKREKVEKERQKKEDKDRSESRISVLMGRRRGKTMSSTDRKMKPVEDTELPPLHMSGIPPATQQRVARLKSTTSPSSSTSSISQHTTPRTPSTSRITSQTASSMQKVSDSSLRSRNQLPTIAGSPSVGTNISQASKEPREPPPSTLMNSVSGTVKETPTKIPRISSRTSSTASPAFKNSTSVRRTSTNTTTNAAQSNNSSPAASTNEFGVLDNVEPPSSKPTPASTQRHSIRSSPSTTSRVPRQVSAPTSTTNATPRKSNRDSLSFSGLRKASTSSVATSSSVAPSESQSHPFSALSPSKGLKLLSPKMSLPAPRSSHSSSRQSVPQSAGTPSSSRQSLSTPSPAPSSVDEEELLGDEEMLHYIRRQQAKKMANGATQSELDELLRFPEPQPPGIPLSPEALLKGSQSKHLSEYERKEILDYPNVYYIGAGSQKKPATPDHSTNNYGYDDERGDYLVVNHDHLAYRYEIIDTLGKGSFGQVLHCRDHCTGESVAVKIIRNKKRFHHQAMIEIKILDNLLKWASGFTFFLRYVTDQYIPLPQDEKEEHHVIKMTEHFYFRNHLCIAMELLSINLYELIKANGFVGFTTTLIRRFTSQMLMSLILMRKHRIVHCDLKPENVLLRHPAKSAIKVIDFGSSCLETEKVYTYIQSRFYRSPEVILGMNYHMAIDMWSLGCILAELYTGYPIFPGENEQEQLSCIMEVLGIPDKDFINRSTRKRIFFDNNGTPRPVVNSKGRRRRPGTKNLAQVLRSNDEDFIDFIAKCLIWDPDRRIKPQQAIVHPFVTGGRRVKATNPSPAKGFLSSGSSSRHKTAETPKKSQIGAPTPLTSRTSRTTGTVPTTPGNSSTHASTLGSSRSYRQSQPQGMSTYHSARTLTTTAK
ncbi:hypothetical protein PLICRDRAFT_175129 [Plicaturopsis crispa FD-325 SS-3]|nr:hypothetical protein PLICRDRAFT_175129 [Plicaturopsis crispa FD-325 SS-3]